MVYSNLQLNEIVDALTEHVEAPYCIGVAEHGIERSQFFVLNGAMREEVDEVGSVLSSVELVSWVIEVSKGEKVMVLERWTTIHISRCLARRRYPERVTGRS